MHRATMERAVLLHLEFYWIPPQGSVRYCERITVNATSIDQAVAHAGDVLENQSFPFGKANLCLIKKPRRPAHT